jgi:hypothetical protein
MERRAHNIRYGICGILVAVLCVSGTVALVRGTSHTSSAEQARLEAAGLSPSHAARLVERLVTARGEVRTIQEDLRPRSDSAAYVQSMAALDRLAARLQAELGPSDYDWLLYAADRENRVVVASVSAAGQTPRFHTGDVLIAYGRQRIFTPGDLRHALGTEQGATVAVRVLRGDHEVAVHVPKRPLAAQGISLEARRVVPSTAAGRPPPAATSSGSATARRER